MPACCSSLSGPPRPRNRNPRQARNLYCVFVCADGGGDLEGFDLRTAAEARSLLLQVALTLAVGEAACRFEHRDLHWGNVLLRRTGGGGAGAGAALPVPAARGKENAEKKKKGGKKQEQQEQAPARSEGEAEATRGSCRLRGVPLAFDTEVRPPPDTHCLPSLVDPHGSDPSHPSSPLKPPQPFPPPLPPLPRPPPQGLEVTLIDFTLSRLDTPSGVAFCDMEADPELFDGPTDSLQAETYRRMRKAVRRDWRASAPKTNALWLHYLADVVVAEKKVAGTAVRRPGPLSARRFCFRWRPVRAGR